MYFSVFLSKRCKLLKEQAYGTYLVWISCGSPTVGHSWVTDEFVFTSRREEKPYLSHCQWKIISSFSSHTPRAVSWDFPLQNWKYYWYLGALVSGSIPATLSHEIHVISYCKMSNFDSLGQWHLFILFILATKQFLKTSSILLRKLC